jgi:glycerophosphoryl diester phosphodiesterase
MSEAAATFDLQGHRGARALRPENTLASFAHALAIGVTTLELDAGVTSDGVVVVSHDTALNPDHTRDASGRWLEKTGPTIVSLTFAELQAFDVGRLRPGTAYAARFPEQTAVDGERIPRLADVFDLVKKSGNTEVRFNIETKIDPRRPDATPGPEAFAEALVAEIRLAAVEKRSMIQSFDWRTLGIVQRIAPEIETVCLTTQHGDDDNLGFGRPGPSPWLGGLNTNDFDGSVPRLVKAAGATVWSPDFTELTPQLVAEAHALALRVIPWTANHQDDMARLIDMRIDGLITDRPDLLRRVLQQKGRAVPPSPIIAPQ